jgi:predicted porin
LSTTKKNKSLKYRKKKNGNIANEKNAKALYATLGYDITDALNISAGYTNISQDKNDGDGDSNEYEIATSYQINKKFAISAYYDVLDMKQSSATDQQEGQVEFEYDF